MANCLAELTFPVSQDAAVIDTKLKRWILYVDGSSNSDGSGAGLLLKDPHGEMCSYALQFDFAVSNNEAEYEALIVGLQLALPYLDLQRLLARSVSGVRRIRN